MTYMCLTLIAADVFVSRRPELSVCCSNYSSWSMIDKITPKVALCVSVSSVLFES